MRILKNTSEAATFKFTTFPFFPVMSHGFGWYSGKCYLQDESNSRSASSLGFIHKSSVTTSWEPSIPQTKANHKKVETIANCEVSEDYEDWVLQMLLQPWKQLGYAANCKKTPICAFGNFDSVAPASSWVHHSSTCDYSWSSRYEAQLFMLSLRYTAEYIWYWRWSVDQCLSMTSKALILRILCAELWSQYQFLALPVFVNQLSRWSIDDLF